MALSIVSLAWILYAVAAVACVALVARAHRATPGLVAIVLLLAQQAAGTTATLLLYNAGSADVALGAFRAGSFVWLLWGPIVFLAAPLLLHGSRLERPALVVGVAGALPNLTLAIAGLVEPGLVFSNDLAGLSQPAMLALVWTFTGFAVTVALLAAEALTTTMPLRRAQFALLAGAFGVEGAFHASQGLVRVLLGRDVHGIEPFFAMRPLLFVPFLVLLPTAVAIAVVALHERRSDRARWAGILSALLVGALATGAVAAPLLTGDDFRHPSGLLHVAWDLAGLVLLVYAALRFQLFDLELRVRQGVVVSSAIGLGFMLYITVQELAEGLIEDAYFAGLPAAGLVSALAVGAASIPIARFAQRLGRRMFPQVGLGGYGRKRGDEIYLAALEGSLMDGTVSPTEANALRRLREELGLSLEDHERLEGSLRAHIGDARESAPSPAS